MPRKKTSLNNIPELTENKRIHSHVSKCAGVVGGMGAVTELAAIWEQHGHLFQLITSNDMLDFCTTEEFTSVEYQKYLRGTSAIPTFLMQCYTEVLQKRAEKIQENE